MMKDKYTILMLGETGAGKSTTLNAIANYCQSGTFEQAEIGEFLSIIPSRITLPDPNTFQPTKIGNNLADENENHNDQGESVTQDAKKYEFKFAEKTIEMIDTPGMGDTRGIDVDKKNFAKIIDFVTKKVDSIHAICFLIKTITTRKTAVFQYCLNEILTRLTPEACSNIIFLFTFSRNSFYGPADGFETVRAFLREDQLLESKIELKVGVNCFFIDNEAYQYLLAKKHGFQFKEDIRESYKESWNKSVENITKMLAQIEIRDSPILVRRIFKNSQKKQIPTPEPEPEPNPEPKPQPIPPKYNPYEVHIPIEGKHLIPKTRQQSITFKSNNRTLRNRGIDEDSKDDKCLDSTVTKGFLFFGAIIGFLVVLYIFYYGLISMLG